MFREQGWVASFFSNEGAEPPHLHIRKGGGEAKFWLGRVRLASSRDLKVSELAEAEQLVRKHAASALEKWHEHFD